MADEPLFLGTSVDHIDLSTVAVGIKIDGLRELTEALNKVAATLDRIAGIPHVTDGND